MRHSIVIAAALIAGAILAHTAWTQSTTTSFATAIVVTACGTPVTSAMWPYTNGTQAPLTMDTTGSLCEKTTP